METLVFDASKAMLFLEKKNALHHDTEYGVEKENLSEQDRSPGMIALKKPKHVVSCSCSKCKIYHRKKLNGPNVCRFNATGVRAVDAILCANGFRRLQISDFTRFSSILNLIWTPPSASVKRNVYSNLQKHQKINSFPCSGNICRKDELYRNFLKMREIFGEQHFNFIPKSYILPQDRQDFTNDFFKSKQGSLKDQNSMWIVKPVNRACGKGIRIYKQLHDINVDEHYQPPLSCKPNESVIISKYVDRLILFNRRKFDLRVYVLVTSFEPLRIYMYSDGLVRVASESFSTSDDKLTNQFVHLTNSFVQKKHPEYVSSNAPSNVIPELQNGMTPNKLSFVQFKHFAEQKEMKLNFTEIFVDIEDIAIKVILSMEKKGRRSSKIYSGKKQSKDSCFQLFGFDFILETPSSKQLKKKTKVWLVEVNGGPSLGTESVLDKHLKVEMLSEMFNIIGMLPVDFEKREIQRFHCKKEAKRQPSANSKERPDFITEVDSQSETSKEHENRRKQKLKEKIVEQIQIEQKKAKNWKLIFPTNHSEKFHNFFEEQTEIQDLVFEFYRHH